MRTLFICLTLFLLSGIRSEAQNRLFTVLPDSVVAIAGTDSTAVRGIRVTASVNQLRLADATRLSIPLPGRSPINVIRGRADTDRAGRVAWYGTVENDPGSFVLFSLVKNVITGQIQLSNGKKYRITYKGNNVHEIAEIDLSRVPDTGNDMIKPSKYDTLNTPMDLCADSPLNIDVMVVYTPQAETFLGTEGALIMESLIYQNIYLTNIAYENSNIDQRLRLVHIANVPFPESGFYTSDAARIEDPTDPVMNTIRTMRNTHRADIVVIMVNELDRCGWSFTMSTVTPAHEAFAYSVVRRQCAAERFTFPHELGHIMSARHNWHDDNANLQPYTYNHGHIYLTTSGNENIAWKTVMSVTTPGSENYVQIPYFSNPNLSYTYSGNTAPLGNATADNALTLNNTASTVSAFRCGAPPVNNVWMRDTYNDTGQEPDPATAAQSMCMSPYIWIRNTKDVPNTDPPFLFANQHRHQNPIFGQDNWIYVKLHNGATTISGNLEVYGAPASSGLVWPGSWTLIKTLPITMSPQSTMIAETKWENLPAAGHYCLLARWVSASDPMTPPETADINTNTRQSNNIIWRNLNIVDLSAVGEVSVEMNVENNTDHPLQLVFEDEAKFPKVPFLHSGNILVIMDSALCYGWQKGKSEYNGLEPEFARIKLLESRAELNNITLPPGKRGKLTIIFKKGTTTPRDRFLFTVKQYAMDKKKRRLMGEVGYEIYTFKR